LETLRFSEMATIEAERVETGTSEARPVAPGALVALAFLAAAVFVAAVVVMMQSGTGEGWTALFEAPVLVVLSLPILARQARREGDRRVLWILVIALFAKLLGAVIRHYVTFEVYAKADATGYHESGLELYKQIRSWDLPDWGDYTGTNFIRIATGVAYAILGPTKLGGFLLYSWLGFWGLFCFYRAFTIAVPEGRSRAYARILFFLPSLVFWPSSIGKEAWMMFALGIATLGAAHILSGSMWRGIGIAVAGLWLAMMVRPHVAGIMGLALAGAYFLRRPKASLGALGPAAKLVGMGTLVIVAFLLVSRTTEFLEQSGIRTSKGATKVFEQIQDRTAHGGSDFVPSVVDSPWRAPIAAFTVLFRPHLLEAHNTQAQASAVEGTFLLLFALFRFRKGWGSLRTIRRQPYVAFAIVYVGLFIVAFSGMANFGLLARERVQLFPLFLVPFFVLPRGKEAEGTESTSESEGTPPALEPASAGVHR